MEAMRRDKKVVDGRLHFVIAIEIGATMTVDDVTEDELRAVLVRLGLKRLVGEPVASLSLLNSIL